MMSRPATTSGFNDDDAASSGYSIAGRRLANSLRSFCGCRADPLLGRTARGSVSYCGPPTQPSRMASAARALLLRHLRIRVTMRVVRRAAEQSCDSSIGTPPP